MKAGTKRRVRALERRRDDFHYAGRMITLAMVGLSRVAEDDQAPQGDRRSARAMAQSLRISKNAVDTYARGLDEQARELAERERDDAEARRLLGAVPAALACPICGGGLIERGSAGRAGVMRSLTCEACNTAVIERVG